MTDERIRWGAWAGTRDDLERLVESVDDLVVACSVGEPSGQAVVTHGARKKKKNISAVSGDESHHALKVRIDQAGEYVEGAWQTALPKLDTRTYSLITLKASLSSQAPDKLSHGTGWSTLRSDFIRLTLDRRHVPGVELRLTSARQDWAAQALWQISKEVGRNRPRWAWVNSDRGAVAFFVALTACAYLISAPILIAINLDALRVVAFATIAAFLASATGTLWTDLRPWLFPPFEVVENGQSINGVRRIVSLGAFVATAAASIGTNLFTDSL